jgi:hypothetical protein
MMEYPCPLHIHELSLLTQVLSQDTKFYNVYLCENGRFLYGKRTNFAQTEF